VFNPALLVILHSKTNSEIEYKTHPYPLKDKPYGLSGQASQEGIILIPLHFIFYLGVPMHKPGDTEFGKYNLHWAKGSGICF